jgi:hypothetical protein
MENKRSWMRNTTLLAVILLAALVVTAGAGLFGTVIYDPWSPAKYVQESRAQDLITLVLGVPLIVVALWAMRREKAWSFPLWTGVLAYELYVYAIYVFGGVYSVFFLGYIAAAGLALYTIIGLLSGVDADWFQAAVSEKMPRRWIGVFFLLIVAVFGMIWLGQVMNTISTGVVDSGHLIFVIDLMIVLPAFGIAAVKLFQKKAFGDLLAGMLLIKFDSLCIAIALGQLFRSLNGIDVERELLGVFIPLGLIGLLFTAVYFRNLE